MKAPLSFLSPSELTAKKVRLESILRELGSALVAYSGGVDSTLLLRLAYDVLGERTAGVIAISETIPSEEVAAAETLARQIGVRLYIVHTREYENQAYRANTPDRCYYCKMALFDELEPLARRLGFQYILYGANHDDLSDYRPGQRAAVQRGVRAPLAEAHFSKLEVRELSRQLGLPTWNKPAMACLASRIPYGTSIERDTLQRIAQAERFLRDLGVTQVRVRTYGTIARIEVEQSDIEHLVRPEIRQQLIQHLKGLGYEFVTLDLEGFRSGSMNPKLEGSIRF